MSIATTRFVAGADRFAALHADALPQVDELCGCFHAHLALRLAGIDVGQEDVGLLAGSCVSAGRSRDVLPAGETGREPRVAFPLADAAASGTSPAGLQRAVTALGAGVLAAIPIAGPFTRETTRAVLDGACMVERPLVLAANVATAPLWGSHPTAPQILAYLASGDDTAGPAPDWDVGHFVSLLGTIEGAAGTLVVVADTYRSLGLGAVHLQPIERLVAALRRESFPGDGGILAIVGVADEAGLRSGLEAAGLELGLWDNGSPDLGV